jgi:hypothetical protein
VRHRELSFLIVIVTPVLGADFTLRTVDGLNGPISGVKVEVSCVSGDQSTSLLFESDQNGMVYGTYDAALCAPRMLSVTKDGYSSYLSGFRGQYVLRRQSEVSEVERIANLQGEAQLRGLREVLAGANRFMGKLFYYEDRLRPALRTLALDPDVAEPARDLLSLIGVPEDLHLLVRLASPQKPSMIAFPERWRYQVATALVNPDNEDEWSFLRRCASNEFSDRWVDAGAIQTLRVTGASRSQEILGEAQIKNSYRASMITKSRDNIKSNPVPLEGPELEELARHVAQALKLGNWEGNGMPSFNETGDKASVDLTFQAGSDYIVYTATFHHMNGVWTLRGAYETSQAFRMTGVLPRKQ